MSEKKLTELQKRFADYYIELANATEAYKKAGYKAKGHAAEVNANRLLSNAEVRAYIDERLAQKDSDRIASQDEVLQFLTSVMRGEVMEQIPVTMKDSWEMVSKEPSLKDRIKAAEQIGKRHGIWKETFEHSGSLVVIKGEDSLED